MDKFIERAMELSKDIMSSSVFKDYIDAKDALSKNIAAQSAYLTYKKKNISFQMNILNNKKPDFNEEMEMSFSYSEMMQNELIKNFINTEKTFVGLINDIMMVFGNDYEPYIDFWE